MGHSTTVIGLGVLGGLGALVFLLLLVISSLPSPTVTRLLRRWKKTGQ